MKFDIVQAWIDSVAFSHSKNVRTEKEYKYSLKKFCDFIGKTPKQVLEEYEKADERRFRRKYAQYVRAYISQMTKNHYAPSTVRTKVAIVKSFFKYNDLPLGYVPTGRFKIKFHNRDTTKEEIIRILEGSKPRDKAFFCMMAQTGLRPDTLCNLKLKHIQPEFEKGIIPCKIDVPQEIAKGEYRSYFTFMGEESVKYLRAYLNTRPGLGPEDYLFTSHGTDKRANPKSMSRIFARTLRKLERKGIIKIQNRQFGKPAEVRLYNLRKFFRKYANQAGFEYVQFWMGHIVKEGQEEHYRPKDVEFHRELYAEKAMPFLRLETATPSEREKEVIELRDKVERLSKENEELRRKLDEFGLLEDEVTQLKRDVEKVKASRIGRIGPGAILGVALGLVSQDVKGTSKTLQELVRKRANELLQQIKKKRGLKTDEEALQVLLKEFINGMAIS